MFELEKTAKLRDFVFLGRSFSKEPGSLELDQIEGTSSPVFFNNGNECQTVYINNSNISDLMKHGIFNQGIYNKEVVIIKNGNYVNFIPVDSESYQTLVTRDVSQQKLVEGFTYSMEDSYKFGTNFTARYLGIWYCYEAKPYWNQLKETKKYVFLDNYGNILFYNNRKYFILKELLENTPIMNSAEFHKLILEKFSFTISPNKFNFEYVSKTNVDDINNLDMVYQEMLTVKGS